MPDRTFWPGEPVPLALKVKYQDMGDGTHALVQAVDGEVDIADRVGRLVGRITHYDRIDSGELTAAEETVEINCGGLGTVGLGISGTWTGTIIAEINVGDGVWDTIPLIEQTLGSGSLNTTSNGNFLLGVSGTSTLRVRASAWTSGTAVITFSGSAATGGTFLTRPIPTGVNNIGDVDVASIALPSSVYNGQKTISAAGTAEALATSQTLERGVTIKALASNTNNVYVGDSSVDDTNGFVLAAGEEIPVKIDNLAKVYIDVDTNGEGASYVAS